MRGALAADLAWKNSEMQCDGDTRGKDGLRVTIVGPLPASANPATAGKAQQLRFIFGIDLHDTAAGVAQAFPTNLTVIVEGAQQMYATRGNGKCAVESLLRSPESGKDGKLERVKVRGYCIDPAADASGEHRLLIPTFSFTALVRTGDEP